MQGVILGLCMHVKWIILNESLYTRQKTSPADLCKLIGYVMQKCCYGERCMKDNAQVKTCKAKENFDYKNGYKTCIRGSEQTIRVNAPFP